MPASFFTTCIKNDLIKLTLYQFVGEIYEDDFNAFTLQAEVTILPELTEESDLPSSFIIAAFKAIPKVLFHYSKRTPTSLMSKFW